MFEAERPGSGFQDAVAQAPQARDGAAQSVVELLRAGIEALHTNREAAKHYISRACSALIEGHKQPDISLGSNQSVPGGLISWQTKRLKAHIESNLEKQLSVRQLAAIVRLGPSHFQRAFRRSFGVSPHAYVVGRRIERAQEIMLQSDAPLSQIALDVGFSDQAHLTTRFRRAVGVTPATWRRERKEVSDGSPDVVLSSRAAASHTNTNVPQRRLLAA
jgi:AraC-like DNA-binding protein